MRLLENIEKLIPLLVFIGLMYFNWWSNRQAAREDEESADPAEPAAGPGRRTLAGAPGGRSQELEAEEQERARRLQEEIRRRIAERRAEPVEPGGVETPVAPPPLPHPVAQPARPASPAAFPGSPATFESRESATARAEAAVTHESILRLAQERKRLEAETARVRAATRKFPQPDSTRRAASPAMGGQAGGSALLAGIDLADPAAARRAIVLAEILNSPVGMRPRTFIWED